VEVDIVKGSDVVFVLFTVACALLGFLVGMITEFIAWRYRIYRALRFGGNQHVRGFATVAIPLPDGKGPGGWKTVLGILGTIATLLGGMSGKVPVGATEAGTVLFGGLTVYGLRSAIAKVIALITELISVAQYLLAKMHSVHDEVLEIKKLATAQGTVTGTLTASTTGATATQPDKIIQVE
jgi:hypothetical protein